MPLGPDVSAPDKPNSFLSFRPDTMLFTAVALAYISVRRKLRRKCKYKCRKYLFVLGPGRVAREPPPLLPVGSQVRSVCGHSALLFLMVDDVDMNEIELTLT